MYQLTDHSLNAGLPDGIFSNRKIPIWVNFGGYIFMAIWSIIGPLV
jgi:hypothetical protein